MKSIYDSHEKLFNIQDLQNVLTGKSNQLVNEIDNLNEEELQNTNEETFLTYLEEKYSLITPILDEVKTAITKETRKIETYDHIFQTTGTVDGNRITFIVPFEGDAELFKYRASTFTFSYPYASIKDGHLAFIHDVSDSQDPDSLKNDFTNNLNSIKDGLSLVAKDVINYNQGLKLRAKTRIDQRKEKFKNDQKLITALGFPLVQRENVPKTYAIPTIKRKIPEKPSISKTSPIQPEPTLDMENYKHILSIITNMALVLERSPKAFKTMGEEDLRQHFLVQLNGHFEGQATGETFNMNGKTDILIRQNGRNVFIAECKFWKGPSVFNETIDQLLGYLTWRDSKAALIIFNRDTQLTTVLEKIPDIIKKHPSYIEEHPSSSETSFRYVLKHNDDEQREIIVTVLVFEIPQ